MSEEKVIVLESNRAYFEEIYFSGNRGSLFFSPTTKGKTFTTIIVAMILLLVFIFKDDFTKEKSGILYFISFLFLLCAVFLSVSINKVSRWKKQVNVYLQKIENCEVYEIRYSRNFFSVRIDEDEETSEWKEFQSFESTEKYLALEGKYSYVFPKKSIDEKDFNLLKQTLKKNITE